jgi:hypothetical protein
MVAKLEIGEVSLTTRMGDVFGRFGQSILAGNGAFAQFDREGVVIQRRKLSRLAKRKPTFRVATASQFNLHVALPLAWTQRQAGYSLVIDVEGYAHQ